MESLELTGQLNDEMNDICFCVHCMTAERYIVHLAAKRDIILTMLRTQTEKPLVGNHVCFT